MDTVIDLTCVQPLYQAVDGGREYSKAIYRVLLSRMNGGSAVAFSRFEIPEDICRAIKKANVKIIFFDNDADIIKYLNNTQIGVFVSFLPYRFGCLGSSIHHYFFTIHGLRDYQLPFDLSGVQYYGTLMAKIRYLMSNSVRVLLKCKYRSNATSVLASECSKLSCYIPSVFTKESVLRCCPKSESDINVLYSPPTRNMDFINPKAVKDRDSIVLIGGNRWYKNIKRGIDAAIRIRDESGGIGSIRVPGFSATSSLRKLYEGNGIEFYDYLSEESYGDLISKSQFAYFGSFDEGFGYPVVELMHGGCAALFSEATSIPEIAQDGGLYCNPHCVESIYGSMLRLVSMTDIEREALLVRASRRVSHVISQQELTIDRVCGDILKAVSHGRKGTI